MFPALCPSYQTWKICNAFNVKMHNYEKQVKTDYFCCITCPDEYKNLVQEKKKFWSEIHVKHIFLFAFDTDMTSLIFMVFNPFLISL